MDLLADWDGKWRDGDGLMHVQCLIVQGVGGAVYVCLIVVVVLSKRGDVESPAVVGVVLVVVAALADVDVVVV